MNRLAPQLININSTAQFKKSLNTNLHNKSDTTDVFKYLGSRYINIILCQLRNRASNLNHDRYKDHLIESPMCDCNHSFETVTYYFTECNNFRNLRQSLEQQLLHQHHNHMHVNVLINGCVSCNDNQNKDFLMHVSNFIVQSKRL